MDKSYILVVDDNHINRLFFQSALGKMNHQVSTAESGYEALELCRKQAFDMILMDIRMQGMNGIEAAREISQLPHHSSTPIIAISADVFDFSQHPQFADGLMKPVKPEVMQQMINRWIRKTPWFDDQQALQVSHNDAGIVNKLRALLQQELPVRAEHIKQLYRQKQYTELADSLHQLLGSARICAASRLTQQLEQFRKALDEVDDPLKMDESMEDLLAVMSETSKQAAQPIS
jgi:CheY-like chemotaxis protein